MHTVVSYHEWDDAIKEKIDPKKHSARKMEVDYFMSDDKHHDAFYVADNMDDLTDLWEDEKADELLTISDGGPNHYKCRQHFYNMMKRKATEFVTNGSRKRSRATMEDNGTIDAGPGQHIKIRRMSHAIRGENHGKGVGDAFNATGKGCFAEHERKDRNDDEKMTTSHIHNASDCVRVGNASQQKKRDREGWQDDMPQVPRKGRRYVAHKITYHETSAKWLEERRDRYKDVKAIDGTQTHYHFYFPEELGSVDLRYLTCLCGPCRNEDWDRCINMEYVGGWRRHKFEYATGAGVRDLHHNAERRRRADQLADSLIGNEEAVALYTTEGICGERMWLMKPTCKPWTVGKGETHSCPMSGEEFGQGERVLQGEYYEIVPRTDGLYEHRPDLGVFSVPARMLRAGGATEPIRLELQPARNRRARKFYKLHEHSATRVTDLLQMYSWIKRRGDK